MTRALSEIFMSYRKNATTLVIRTPKGARTAKAYGTKRGRASIVTALPNRHARSFMAMSAKGPELKQVAPHGVVGTPVNGQFTVGINLLPIILGNGPTGQRVGRKITLRTLQIRAIVEPNTALGGHISQVRFVVVYDKSPGGNGAPTALDVFDIDAFISPHNINNSERFLTIIDEISDSCQSSSLNMAYNCFRKLKYDTVFGANNGNENDINTGGLWLFMAHNDTINPVTNSTDTYVKVRYSDQ